MIDDGVAKFKLTLRRGPPLPEGDILSLEKWRAILYRLALIGEYPIDKIGYGNLSRRLSKKQTSFVITGTQTGKYAHLKREHYTKVFECDIQKMQVKAEGPIAPSSESLTHYAIYESNPQVQTVFHVHHKDLWQKLIAKKVDAIDESILYGTKEMAIASKEVIDGKEQGILVMKGHADGILAYGPTPEITGKIILKYYRELGPQQDS